ncbi:MAG TPA: tripartite tricarboxylate transporter substrate binding protein [Burkholderiales bacterium]|nr:tripartite tricarboxylate transporter substrate binding protein [Burkholderiales bacterium]
MAYAPVSQFVRCIAGAAAFVLLCGPAWAQFPVRPVRMLVPNPPGGATDTLARVVGPKLSEALGQPVVVDNRPGSNGNLATEATAKAAPDGHTLMLAADGQIVISPHLYRNLAVDTLKELVPVASLVSTQMLLAVNPALPVKNLQEFVDYARRASPPLAYASIGNGSQHHLTMEMLKRRAGINLLHVPYKGGGPATVALFAGEVSVMFGGNSVAPHIRSGKLRALALSGRRNAAYPGLPTLSESYPGLEINPWLGLFAPAGVQAPIVKRLRGEVGRVLADGELRERLRAIGGLDPLVTTPEEFVALIRADYAKYGEAVRTAGVTID